MEGVAINVVLQRIKRKTKRMVDVSYRTCIGQLPTITVLSFSRPFVGVFSVSTRIQRTYYKTVIYKKGNAIYRTVTKLVDLCIDLK